MIARFDFPLLIPSFFAIWIPFQTYPYRSLTKSFFKWIPPPGTALISPRLNVTVEAAYLKNNTTSFLQIIYIPNVTVEAADRLNVTAQIAHYPRVNARDSYHKKKSADTIVLPPGIIYEIRNTAKYDNSNTEQIYERYKIVRKQIIKTACFEYRYLFFPQHQEIFGSNSRPCIT